MVDATREGTPLGRIAVLYASPEPYARIAHEQLRAAGITTNGAAVMPLAARVAGRTLLGLLDLPAAGFRRQDVFAWLAGAPISHRGRLGATAAWERLSRDASVVAGRRDWDKRLATSARQLADEAESRASDPDAPEWRVEAAERRCGPCRVLCASSRST